MAKVRSNIIIQGLSGMLGNQLVIKQDKAGRTIVSVRPTFDENREFTEEQKAHQEAFKEATAYAKDAKGEAVYAEKAEGTPMTSYNVAVADWFHPPEITEVDLSAWTGQIGETIRVKAVDDVKVEQVTIVITDEADAVLEQGAATQAVGLWWEYTTTAEASGNPKVVAAAMDLPGHIDEVVQQK